MVARLKNLKRGFTLVELMIVVAIIGILAALAIYGVTRYVTNAKSAEAREMLGRIAKNAVTAFDTERMKGDLLAAGATAAVNHRLCASATAVPDSMTKVKGAKYQSQAKEWENDSTTAGWACLKFSITGPQYFQYRYNLVGTSAFTALARGDLNGNAVSSQFELRGVVRNENNKQIATFSPNFIETRPEE